MMINIDSMSHKLSLPPLTDRTISVSGSAGSLVDGDLDWLWVSWE